MSRIDAFVSTASEPSRFANGRGFASEEAADFRSALDQISAKDEPVQKNTVAEEEPVEDAEDQVAEVDEESEDGQPVEGESSEIDEPTDEEPNAETDDAHAAVVSANIQTQPSNTSRTPEEPTSDQPKQNVDTKNATVTNAKVVQATNSTQQQVAEKSTVVQPVAPATPQASTAQAQATVTITELPVNAIISTDAGSSLSTDVGKQGQQQINLNNTQDSGNGTDLNVARVARGLRNAVQQNGGTINIRLMPPELGVVRIAVTMQGGNVSAAFQTDSENVTQLLQSQMTHLRNALQQQGLNVERIETQTRQPGGATLQQQQQFGDSASDGRSRGQFQQQQQRGGRQPGSSWQQFVQTLNSTAEES